MPLTNHDLILLGAVALAAFIGARLGLGRKSDTAGIARVEQKIDRVLSQLGLTGYNIPASNTLMAGSGNPYPSPIADEIINEFSRGRKIEAIKLYREQHQVGLKEAKDAVDQIEQTLR